MRNLLGTLGLIFTKRLLGTLAIVGVIWVLLQFHDSSQDSLTDALIFGSISLVFSFAVIVMIIGTPIWSARSMGLLLSSCATSILYAGAVYARINAKPIPEPVVDLGRSFYVVASPLIAFGITMWVITHWTMEEDTEIRILDHPKSDHKDDD